MNYKYIFWDFNGTIIDDLELCHKLLNEMLIEEHRPTIDLNRYLDIFTFPIKDYYAQVFNLDKTNFNILANRFIERYQPRSLDCNLHEGVVDLFKRIKSKKIKQVVLSASEINRLNMQLNHFGIRGYFDDVLGIDDIYAASKEEVGQRYILKHNINPKDVLMIGDTLHDAEIAAKLGFDCILYTKGHQSAERFGSINKVSDFANLLK